MRFYILLSFLVFWLHPISVPTETCSSRSAEETCSSLRFEAEEFFARENELLRQRRHADCVAVYNYSTNVTEENRQAMIDIIVTNALASKKQAQLVGESNYDNVNDEVLQRQANILAALEFEVLPESEFKLLQDAISNMEGNYAIATICSFKNSTECGLKLEPHIQERMASSRDHEELAYYWKQWYDKAGTPMRANFAKYVELSRKAAIMNDYSSYAEIWIDCYQDPDFEKNLDEVYKAVLPLYREIHGYVRYRLRQHYGKDVVPERGNIPMHLLGNMWAQQWDNIMDLIAPFPEKPFVDITAEMKRQKFTVIKMFELGDEFFRSLGMIALPKSFWKLSVLERPENVSIVCHASAWDMYQDSDVRIKMCTEVSMYYLYVVHHELGHIQYYLQYEQQPTTFRSDPNPGFHEAVGDVIALSVSSPRHLHRIGLSPVGQLDEESRINELFKTAMKKIAFLPFAYTMDMYRYAVFRGEIDEKKWNCAFWKMRSEFSGVEPPVERSDADFDPTAKYHIDSDVEYLRYFAAHIFQFQFHKAMCAKAGQYKPNDSQLTLDNCDIYNSKEAGQAFSKMLSRGASIHWKDALQEFTGETTMDPSALLEYFKPLRRWLQTEIERLDVPLGWDITKKVPSSVIHCDIFTVRNGLIGAHIIYLFIIIYLSLKIIYRLFNIRKV